MTAAEQLKSVAGQVRTYCTDQDNPDLLFHLIDYYKARYGGDWSHAVKIVENTPDDWTYETRHLIRFGEEDLSLVERHFEVSLPESAHAFYREITECVLSLRNVLVVMSPADIITFEEEIRAVSTDKSGITPIRIIRFAHLIGTSTAFAFRKSCADERWRVTGISSTCTRLEVFHSSQADGFEDDEDIDAWMERMIRTDGFPLMVGNEEYEIDGNDTHRVA